MACPYTLLPSFPESLNNAFSSWRVDGSFPKVLSPKLRTLFEGTQFQHLFAGLVLYVFEEFDMAAKHFRRAVEKDQKAMSLCAEMGVFHRVCRRMFQQNLFNVIFEQPENFVKVLRKHYDNTHKACPP